ncbi:hypothetical protein LTR70_007376 [Exophiala xenobiotica]|uniref:Uncharacterized protein n=1 Tax=Lithohypha guttulata TaxID=1690604 RepID=A0ABR0K671_9EURO|nr:hypothetical protein LTR24_006895 [Lithohypha guttulata]KAK5313954.1 hypothetical protein LTR70_007376 [Exophiala xenobiotica]
MRRQEGLTIDDFHPQWRVPMPIPLDAATRFDFLQEPTQCTNARKKKKQQREIPRTPEEATQSSMNSDVRLGQRVRSHRALLQSSQAQSSQLDEDEAVLADDNLSSSDEIFLTQDVGDSDEDLDELALSPPAEVQPPAKRRASTKTTGRGTARGGTARGTARRRGNRQ